MRVNVIIRSDHVIIIRYEGNRLTVSHDVDNKRTWKSCFSVDGVYLPTGYYFGISAHTGDLSDNHDVTGLKTYELDSLVRLSLVHCL